jgi:hypothetical protein
MNFLYKVLGKRKPPSKPPEEYKLKLAGNSLNTD